MTLLVCSQCGTGNYCATTYAGVYACTVCGWQVEARYDIAPYLDEGESLTLADGLLAVVSAE